MTIKQDTSTDDTVDPSYTALLSAVPCSIVPVGGGERYQGRQLRAETDYIIETRFYSNLTTQMICVNDVDSTEYTIKRIHNVNGRSRYFLIEAESVT